jgi:threonyl-tRNA synthetase
VLPVWLSPVQAVVIPLSDDHLKYARSVLGSIQAGGVRAEGDFDSGTMGAKIRNAQLQKVPYMLVVGKKEMDSKTVAVRTRTGQQEFGVAVEDFTSRVRSDIANFR